MLCCVSIACFALAIFSSSVCLRFSISLSLRLRDCESLDGYDQK